MRKTWALVMAAAMAAASLTACSSSKPAETAAPETEAEAAETEETEAEAEATGDQQRRLHSAIRRVFRLDSTPRKPLRTWVCGMM